MNTQETELNKILEIIGRIAETTADGDFIYRGEPQHYEKVSSSLCRECETVFGAEQFDIETIQQRMLELAKGYTHEEDDFEILTELQHYGGHTNLIDFTTDNHIALFFACASSLGKPGRIILLERTEEIKDYIKSPRNPQNRVIAQKSVFIRPPQGFLEQKQYTVIDIPGSLKEPILDHLQKQHGISRQRVYNDLHGFIRDQNTHLKECIEVYEVEMPPREDVFQPTPSQLRNEKET
ncbi:MAG: FRG domain-containing protein [Candidatus Poribacteria bacterium]|nr:FRG domain-containing protein [Candidatus Poribacteria bacterium]